MLLADDESKSQRRSFVNSRLPHDLLFGAGRAAAAAEEEPAEETSSADTTSSSNVVASIVVLDSESHVTSKTDEDENE
jgi:hypothetical protein